MIRFVSSTCIAVALVTTGSLAHALPLTGTVYKSNAEKTVSFDLALGDPRRAVYYLQGTTVTDKGYWKSLVDYSKIRTVKETRDAGKIYRTTYANRGTVRVFTRERQLDPGAVLAGVRIEGSYLQGHFDDGLWLQHLIVDGVRSRGVLDYNSYKQWYRARKECSFGTTAIRSSVAESEVVADYDTQGADANQMKVSLRFGGLLVKGRVHYSDIEKTSITDVTHRSTEVVGTTGRVELTVKRLDGSEPEIAITGPATKDELELRRLLAFLELFSFDMWSE